MRGDGVRSGMRLLAVAVLSSLVSSLLLVVVPSATRASAATSCTLTRSVTGKPVPATTGSGDTSEWVSITYPETDQRVPVDVQVELDLRYPDLAKLGVHVYAPGGAASQLFNYGESSGAVDGRYTFSDAAATPFMGTATPAPGTYGPKTAMARLTGKPASGTWMILVLPKALSAGEIRGVLVTYTFTDCPQPDSDRDSVPDAADSCPYVANPGQANSDDDSVGDACDPDDDNDGVDDAQDACPTVAAREGCPVASRKVALRKRKGRKARLTGVVRSSTPTCRAGRVQLKQVRKGRKDRVVARTRSRANGAFSLKAPRRPGRYYAVVPQNRIVGTAVCRAATSAKIRTAR